MAGMFWSKLQGLRLLALLIASAVVSTAGHVHARDADDEYKRITAKAIQDYNAGQYPQARALFLRAHALAPSARTLRALGSTSFELHHYVQAIRELNASLADDRNALDAALRGSVRTLIERAQSRVATLQVAVMPASAIVQLDGRRVSAGRLQVDPGEHRLRVAASGHREQQLALQVESGKRKNLSLQLEASEPVRAQPLPTAQPMAAAPKLMAAPKAALAPSTSSRPSDRDSSSITSQWWFWTGVGVLAAGAVAVGTVVAVAPHDAVMKSYPANAGSVVAP